MAVAGCVFNLNRGNFSAITKFIGTVRAAFGTIHTPDRAGRPRFNIMIARHVDATSPYTHVYAEQRKRKTEREREKTRERAG